MNEPPKGDAHAHTLRLLQDLCSISGQLPSSFELKGVTINPRDVIGRGGEAVVYSGHWNGQKIAVREVMMSESEWHSPRGLTIIQVLSGGLYYI